MTDIVPLADPDVAWHAWRSRGVGGSDIATILGLSSYGSPVSLYFSKLGLLGEHTPDSQRQRIGKRMEAVLAAEFHEDTGLYVVGEQTWCEHPEHRELRCTTDGFVAESPLHLEIDDPRLGTWQAKTDGRFGWPDGPPANIRAQCIWEMGVTGLPHCWLTVMFAGFKIEHFEIPFDADAAADWEFMRERALSFWHDNVLAGIVPPMDDHQATTDALTFIYDADPEGAVDIDEQGRTLVRQVRAAMVEKKIVEATEKRLKNELRAYIGDNTTLIDGYTIPNPRSKKRPQPIVAATWREQPTTSFDKAAAAKRYPRLVEKFTNHGTARVLRVPEQKEG